MRTNIDIDEALVREAMGIAHVATKRGVVTLALQELVARGKQKDIRDLFGQVSFAEGYDYKALREGTPA